MWDVGVSGELFECSLYDREKYYSYSGRALGNESANIEKSSAIF